MEISNRIPMVNNVCYALLICFIVTMEVIRRTKIKVNKTILVPVLIHGVEAWISTELQGCEIKFFKEILGITNWTD